MDQDLVHMVAALKVHMLKPVIENGNAPPIIKVVEGVETTIATTIEKAQRRGNAATKKTQRNLLKQQYENFTASSSEVLDQTFDRLQKLINQLEIHGKSISQEDVNQKFLRSPSPEWNTHTIVWRNKPEIETLSMDDLYNNLKIYEPEVQMVMLTMRARRFLKNLDESFPLNGLSPEEGPTNIALMAYSSTSSNSEELYCLQNLIDIFSSLEDFTSEPIVIKPVADNSEAKASEAKPKAVRKNNGAPIIQDWVSDNEEDDVPQAKIVKKTFKPSFAKIKFVKPKQQEKTARKTVNHVEQNRQNIYTPRGNQTNWNNMMSQRLGRNFMPPKLDLSFSSLEEFTSEPIVIKPIVKKRKAKASKAKPKAVRKNNGALIIKN
ncbi:hypothetical protein Tco_0977528 [Tanacetum coccineum]|uniref:Uncharacterized protein n=1 Tax=Tanacetum coccineum TaxID=301880 RepID=A0ABQ5EKE0_9ASTR